MTEPAAPIHDSRTPTSSQRPLQRCRRWIFRGLLFLAAWGMLEAASVIILQVIAHGGRQAVLDRQQSFRNMTFRSERFQEAGFNSQTIHPFLGWVRNPDVLKEENYLGTKLTTNRFGLLDTSQGIFSRDPKRLIVGVTGGSVAHQMSCAGAERLSEILRAIPKYRDREVVIVRMAQSAYKQPQGLFTLNYYMLQGGEFDIVINLDGLNELTMSVSQNFPVHIALDYPQGWRMRTAEIIPPDESHLAMELIQIRGQRRLNALSAAESVIGRLPSQVLWWHVRDERLRSRMIELQERASRDSERHSFLRCGPEPLATNEAEALKESVRVWKQSSLQMHRLCQASDILYVHAIQPNQYDPGSKPLDTSELDLMKPNSPGNRDQDFVKIVAEGYPQLRDAGADLRKAGVHVLDITQIFSEVREPLYVDSCCHVNSTGSEMIAGAIANYIRDLDK